MLVVLSLSALAAELPDPAVASALADHPPDLPSCLDTAAGEALLMVGIGADGKVTKVTVDHADAAFPEDCGLSVLREVPFPAGERTLAIGVRKSPGHHVVTYGPSVGDLRLEALTRPPVVDCALSYAGVAAEAAKVRAAWGPSGKATQAQLVSGAFGADALQACVLGAYADGRLAKGDRGGAVLLWETVTWTAAASR